MTFINSGRQASIESLARAVAQSPDGIAVLAWNGVILYANPAWMEMHGYSEAEMIGRRFQDLYPGEEMERSAQETVSRLTEQDSYAVEIDHVRRDGTPFRAWLITTLLRDENGDPNGFVLTARDITEWNRLKEQLEEEKARLEQQYQRQRALASITLAINQPSELMLSLERIVTTTTELLPASGGASILLWDPDSETFTISASSIPGQQPSMASQRIRQRGGATRWIIDNKRPLVVNDIRENPFDINSFFTEFGLQAYVGVPMLSDTVCTGVLYALDKQVRNYSTNDIDFLTTLAARASTVIIKVRLYERMRETNELLQQQTSDLALRNADLDAFAHSVAHDLKNPLTSLVGYAELLIDDYDLLSDKERLEFLGYIAKRGMKMHQIVDELLLMSQLRNQEVYLSNVNMTLIVDEACSRLDNMISRRAATLHFPHRWPQVIGHPHWLEAVWTNYVSNAIKYGGFPPEVWLGFTECRDGFVRFWVRDNGAGLSIAEQQSVFLPFTRLPNSESEGHGIGLSIVRRIVEKCGGSTGVESTPGEGSTFWFTLPKTSRDQ